MADVYVNETEGLQRVMNNKKLYARVLKKFKTDTNLDALTTAIAAQDYTQAEIAAHTIKGIAGNLSFTELFNQLQTLDKQLKTKLANPAEAAVTPAMLVSLQVCFQSTLTAIDEVLTHYA
jgi:HPt (histidine-containing phosphotransfer) domain-containing protein